MLHVTLTITCVSILLGIRGQTSSWVLQRSFCLPKRKISHLPTVYSNPDIFYMEESDCPDEDEPDIDWGKMSRFSDNDEEDFPEEKAIPIEEEANEELEPQSPYVRQVERTVEKSRTIFEMNWQIENCVVDADSCEDYCGKCAGSGKNWCKFCLGTGVISFGNELHPCTVCTDGRVECSACSGTGKVSPWAVTYGKTL